MKRFLPGLLLAVVVVSPVYAASLSLVYYQYSEGGASAHVVERLDEDCLMSDDSETRIYEGTLAVGQQLAVTWDWCAPADIAMEQGYTWEGSFEGLAIDMTGKGHFLFEVLEDTVPLAVHSMPSPGNGYQAWHRCATYHNRVDATGSSSGTTTMRLTNIGAKQARDISIATHVGTNHSSFLNAHCPFTSDWGI